MKRKILNGIFCILYTLVATTWIIDFVNVKIDNDPFFCINLNEKNYDDGNVLKCNGLGYVIRRYNRDSLTKGYTFENYFGKEVNYEK